MLHPPVESGQYTSPVFTQALLQAGIAGSIGGVGNALDNALMKSTIGLSKTELIDRHERSWTGRAEVERETAAWVHCGGITRLRGNDTTRLHSSIGYLPPAEHEQHCRDVRTTETSSTPDVA